MRNSNCRRSPRRSRPLKRPPLLPLLVEDQDGRRGAADQVDLAFVFDGASPVPAHGHLGGRLEGLCDGVKVPGLGQVVFGGLGRETTGHKDLTVVQHGADEAAVDAELVAGVPDRVPELGVPVVDIDVVVVLVVDAHHAAGQQCVRLVDLNLEPRKL